MYVGGFPELATAAVEGPKTTDRGLEYIFTRAVGAKG
jgi:PRTRC genetic system protein C